MRFCVHEARRPGWPRALVISLLVLAALVAAPNEASAQGFLDKLFGGWGGSSSPPPPPPMPQIQLPPPTSRPIYGSPNPAPNPWLARPDTDDGPRRGGTYRTLCVRMCDGYYWPISHSTTRSRFYKDAGACRASCGQEAQLFYHPTGADQSEMVDITGRAYTRTPNAFKYRKTLVEGCKCRPEPWAASEIERHLAYASDEAEEARKRIATKDASDTKTGAAVSAAAAVYADGKSRPAGAPDAAPKGLGGDASADAAEGQKAAPAPRSRPVARADARPRPLKGTHPQQPQAVFAHQPSPSPSGLGFPFGAGAKGLKWPGDQ